MLTLNTRLGEKEYRPQWVLSPHLDDAVLSSATLWAGHAGVQVVTALAGMPAQSGMSTEWDRSCGFADAAAALQGRREEDRSALSALGATAVHLPFADGQYGATDDVEALAQALAGVIEQSRATVAERSAPWLAPLGMCHADHLRVRAAWREACAVAGVTRWLAFEDVPYRHIGGSLQEALAYWDRHGWRAYPVRWRDDGMMLRAAQARKDVALRAYASQLAALGDDWLADARAPETYWWMTFGDTSAPGHVLT